MSFSLPSLFKPQPESRRGKYIKYGIIIVVGVTALSISLWLVFRFHSEESTAATFMSEVVAGHYQQAYDMWSKTASYSYQDFLQDWGPKGYYGPVHSFQVNGAKELQGASGVIVTVDVSPFSPFPSGANVEKALKTKEVRLWVQFNNHSISYAP